MNRSGDISQDQCSCCGKEILTDNDKLCTVCKDNSPSKRSKINEPVTGELEGKAEDIEKDVRGNIENPFLVNGDEKFGQYLEAAYNLTAGEKVLDENPIFYGPSADYVEDYDTPLCLGCCVVMNDGNEGNRCSECLWPLCGPDCDKRTYHEENECSLFSENQVVFPPKLVIQHCYKGVAILRGLLLKERNPKVWGDLMNLQHETELRCTPFPDFAQFKQDFGLRDFGANEDWTRILGILNVNSYSIQRVEKKRGSPTFAEFIYPIQSLMAHSCMPNCTWAVTYSPGFVIKVRPAINIKAGEMLSVAYNHDFTKYGCHKRQSMIREQAEFNCRCARCKDSTDVGTYGAAVICFKCKTGLVLPLDSSDADSDWKCNECNYTICQSFVVSFVEALYEQLEMAESDAEETGESLVEILEAFIAKNSATVLHRNHWVLTEASHTIIKKQAGIIEELTEPQLERVTWHCNHLLNIRNVLSPGISTQRGILQHHLARAQLRKTECDIKSKRLTGAENIDCEIKKVYAVQQSALSFWKDNPHYGTLHEDYKHQAKALMDDIERVKSHYFSQSVDS